MNDMATIDNIAATIRKLTKRTGISQAAIARWLGVPEKTLNAWLTGRVSCRHKEMLALALEAINHRTQGIKVEVKK